MVEVWVVVGPGEVDGEHVGGDPVVQKPQQAGAQGVPGGGRLKYQFLHCAIQTLQI